MGKRCLVPYSPPILGAPQPWFKGTPHPMRLAFPIALVSVASALWVFAETSHALGQTPDAFDERLVLDTGRFINKPPDANTISFTMHGEYALRYRMMTDLPLEPPLRDPGATTLGQNQYLYHWFRIFPRFQYRDKFALVGQIDFPRGFVAGDTTQYVDKVRDSYAEARFYDVHPRYLYLEVLSPIGLIRVGQQGSYWGMGLLANDGDHPTLFGDIQRGSLTERILFATTPMGKGTPLTVLIAGDLIFEDNTADLLGNDIDAPEGKTIPGDRAFQGVLAALWKKPRYEAGLYGVIRHQERDQEATGELTPFTEELTVGVVDLAAKFNANVPGEDAYVYGQLESALIFGSTTFLRNSYLQSIDVAAEREPEQVLSYAGAAVLGVVQVAKRDKERWGQVVTEVEFGYASGDANPYDGVSKRFTIDPNHNVGLVLFDHVLAWKTARAATIAQDESIVARPAPGLQFLPSKGGIFGATYLNPRVVVRPRSWLDLKAGVVIAQTTADLVDPYHAGVLGNITNYDGGDERQHDLGAELDLGIDVRFNMSKYTSLYTGAEAGILFPGHAFDDAQGGRLPNQVLANIKLGLHY